MPLKPPYEIATVFRGPLDPHTHRRNLLTRIPFCSCLRVRGLSAEIAQIAPALFADPAYFCKWWPHRLGRYIAHRDLQLRRRARKILHLFSGPLPGIPVCPDGAAFQPHQMRGARPRDLDLVPLLDAARQVLLRSVPTRVR